MFRPLSLVQRYLAAGFIVPFLFSTLFFVCFLLTFQLFRITQLVVNKGVELVVVLELIMHIGVSFLPITIPVSVLFATLFTLNKLSEDSEVLAMRSFGITKARLLWPFLLMGSVVAIGLFSLNSNLIPYSRRVFKNTVVLLTSKGMLTDITKGQFYIDIPNVMLFAEDVQDDGKELYNVFIQSRNDEGDERVIMARRGRLVKQQDRENDIPTLRMHLTDGNIAKVTNRKTKNDVEKIQFEEYDFPIMSASMRPDFVDRESTRTNSELLRALEKDKKALKELVSFKQDSEDYDRQVKELKKSVGNGQLEYWSRMSSPLQCLVFIFLGFALGIKQGRGRGRNSGPVTLMVLSLYYIIFFIGVAFVRKGTIPAWLVAFAPIMIASFVGARYYKKLDWVG